MTVGTGRKLGRKLKIREGYEKKMNTGHTRFFLCVTGNWSFSVQEKFGKRRGGLQTTSTDLVTGATRTNKNLLSYKRKQPTSSSQMN